MAKKPKPWKPKIPYARMSAKSTRLELRPYKASDFKAWQAALRERRKKQNKFDDGSVAAAKVNRGEFRKLILRYRKIVGRNNFKFGVFKRKSGAYLGQFDLFVFSTSHRWANLGYAIHNQYWGRGYASEAAKLALRIGFGALNLNRIEAGCEPANHASAKVARKAGLTFEGKRKKFPIPHPADLLVFAENVHDWKKRHAR